MSLIENAEPPPKTYVVKDKFEFFRPSVQVEMENYDKPETVTEIYIRGEFCDAELLFFVDIEKRRRIKCTLNKITL